MTDEDYMREALQAARKAFGRTSPNPLVGAVIVNNDKIVATGWHHKAGEEHAEINALRAAGDLAAGATMYVTLEPCSHYGKTPPCANAVIKAGIKRVVMAMIDPNPQVAGQGKKLLEEAGIEVTCGVLEAEARKLNEVFLKWITTGRPWVTMKTAMTLDGKIASVSGKSQWITNELSRTKVHGLRDCHDAILVGIGTVLADDPSLTTRLPDRSGKNPLRVIVDSQARTPLTAKVITDRLAPTIIAVTEAAPIERRKQLAAAGAEVLVVNDGPQVDLTKLFAVLGERKLTSVLVEGGGTINYSLLSSGQADKVYAFIAPKFLGGKTALTPVEGAGITEVDDAVLLVDTKVEQFGNDVCVSGYLRK